ncbi:hypothetical protein C1N70_26785 (plasmid) [Cytobacillus firmus]
MLRILFYSYWAYTGLQVAVYSMLGDLGSMAANSIGMLLFALLIQKLKRKEQANEKRTCFIWS